MNTNPVKLMSYEDVCEVTTLAKSTIRKKVSEGRFPKPIYLGAQKAVWPDYLVYDWIHSAIESQTS